MNADLTRFKALIRERCGLLFEGTAERTLADALRARLAATGVADAAQYYRQLAHDDAEFDALVILLTINETYFYREPEHLELAIRTFVAERLARTGNAAPRILSAGCSSGEELYSIAIALREALGVDAARQCVLIGGDIDQAALRKARAGQFTQFSFRVLAAPLRERYFTRAADQRWSVVPELARQTRFVHLNLLRPPEGKQHGQFDIIFFRNVSIYFDAATRVQVINTLARMLKPDGVLFTASAETMSNDVGVLELRATDGVFHFVKASASAKTQITPASPAMRMPHPSAPARAATARAAPAHAGMFSTAPPAPLGATLAAALTCLKSKQWQEACTLLDPALALGNADAALLCAFAALQLKQYASAEQLARQVIAGDAWSCDALIVLALAAKWRGQSEAAIGWLKQAVYGCQHCWPAHFYLAEQYRALGQSDLARRGYRSALALIEQNPDAPDGLRLIPLALPGGEVRFLCRHQLAAVADAASSIGS